MSGAAAGAAVVERAPQPGPKPIPAVSGGPGEGGKLVFSDVSKFYGEVLGVNKVNLEIAPGITGLVGPNGSGKTTLMNLLAGLLRPDRGRVSVLGITADEPEELFRLIGYSTQYDAFPRRMSGFQFVRDSLWVHGYTPEAADTLARQAIARVGLEEAAGRKVAGFSKGMRQRIKLARAIAHRPAVLILDEPLNGLDPMARAEMIDLFRRQAADGLHVLISSHILHEVDDLSDRVVFIDGGYVVAEGRVEGVREEVEEEPIQVLVRCDRPALLASRLFASEHVSGVTLHDDRQGLLVATRDADSFYLDLNRLVLDEDLVVEQVAPADADVGAVYRYLIGGEMGKTGGRG